jgi:putative RecB family exonuclease
MSYELPQWLSPTRILTFLDCPLLFKFKVIDQISEPTNIYAVKGTLIHKVLQDVFSVETRSQRNLTNALENLQRAKKDLTNSSDFADLKLSQSEERSFFEDAKTLIENYFSMEDATKVDVKGVELQLHTDLDGLNLTGILDRLDKDSDDNYIIVDYKTGRIPLESQENERLAQLFIYAILCADNYGIVPTGVKLLYLREKIILASKINAQKVSSTKKKLKAIYKAIERSCEAKEFRPKVSYKCTNCYFSNYCPTKGGDPEKAAIELKRNAA